MSLVRSLAISLRLTCKPDRLTEALEQLGEGSHLYIVSRARRVTIPRKKVRREWRPWVQPGLRGTIEVEGVEPLSIPFTWRTPTHRTRWVGNATDDYCRIVDERGAVLVEGDAHVFALIATDADVRLTLHEVLYVGKSQGRTRTSSSLDRLNAHPPTQKILAGEKDAHHDVFWNLLDLDESAHLAVIGDDEPAPAFGAVNMSALISQALGEPAEQQRRAVDLAEAALIRHFRPRYNCQHKYRFPHARTRTSSSLHSAGHSTLLLLFDTAGQGVRFGTPDAPAAALHWAPLRVTPRGDGDGTLEVASADLDASLRTHLEERALAAERAPFSWMALRSEAR